MRFCKEHWDALRKAIDDRGMTDMVATPETVVKKTAAGQEPLIGAHNMITGVALDVGAVGPHRQAPLPQCPVCELEKFRWIEEAADMMASTLRKN